MRWHAAKPKSKCHCQRGGDDGMLIGSGGLIMAQMHAFHEGALERRLLFAFTHTGADGTLFLEGTSGDDQIIVSFQHTGVALILNGQIELFDEIPPRIHVNAGDGNDTIDAHVAPGGIDLEGDAGNDSILGSVFADTIYGWDGDDTIVGDGGKDYIRGGDGNDSILGDGGANETLVNSDTIFADAGDDFLDADGAIDSARGGDGNDTVMGGPGNDRLIGDAGDDQLDGGPGADRFYGGLGNDTILSRDRNRDTIDGGAGSDDTTDSDPTDLVIDR